MISWELISSRPAGVRYIALNSLKDFPQQILLKKLAEIIKDGSYKDAKSKFQEEAQERVSITPSYKVIKETGPDHEKKFIVGVFLDTELVAEGQGMSKQEAEEAAAELALDVKKWNNRS